MKILVPQLLRTVLRNDDFDSKIKIECLVLIDD